MNLFYTFNNAYIPHLGAFICSLCENNKEDKTIHFYIISMGIKQKTTQMIQTYNLEVTIYEMGDIAEQFDFSADTGGFDVSVLARLLAGEVLPQEVDRVIYLVCDTIILESLHEIFETNPDGYVLAAVSEPTMPTARKESLGLRAKNLYYDCGVLLINLKSWQEPNTGQAVIDYYAAHQGCLPVNDQPDQAMKSPSIFHYLGEGEPHPFTQPYEHYLGMTPWKDTTKEQGWKLYVLCLCVFSTVTKPVPIVCYKVINDLIQAFMKHKAKG